MENQPLMLLIFFGIPANHLWHMLHVLKSYTHLIWVFPKIGVPQNGWFIMENPIKMEDLGVHLFFGNTHILSISTGEFWSMCLVLLRFVMRIKGCLIMDLYWILIRGNQLRFWVVAFHPKIFGIFTPTIGVWKWSNLTVREYFSGGLVQPQPPTRTCIIP